MSSNLFPPKLGEHVRRWEVNGPLLLGERTTRWVPTEVRSVGTVASKHRAALHSALVRWERDGNERSPCSALQRRIRRHRTRRRQCAEPYRSGLRF